MGYKEELEEFKAVFQGAIRNGVFDSNSSQFQGTLIMMMNECERRRQDAQRRLEELEITKAQLTAEVNTWSKMSSIASAVITDLTKNQIVANEESERAEKEKKEAMEAMAERERKEKESATKKPPQKKKATKATKR
jgi:predicted RND superfamily exporter protein